MKRSRSKPWRLLCQRQLKNPRSIFAVGGDSMGWRTVHVVDEHGCLLHTEPVCSYHVDQHPWFENWILAQEVPNQADYRPLLWHPVLGETSETYKDKS
jgi:hypothetical protein